MKWYLTTLILLVFSILTNAQQSQVSMSNDTLTIDNLKFTPIWVRINGRMWQPAISNISNVNTDSIVTGYIFSIDKAGNLITTKIKEPKPMGTYSYKYKFAPSASEGWIGITGDDKLEVYGDTVKLLSHLFKEYFKSMTMEANWEKRANLAEIVMGKSPIWPNTTKKQHEEFKEAVNTWVSFIADKKVYEGIDW